MNLIKMKKKDLYEPILEALKNIYSTGVQPKGKEQKDFFDNFP